MPQKLAIALSLHVLAATFWAGSTFALARTGGNNSGQLFTSQLGAASVAIITGGYLWVSLHEGSFGLAEQALTVGAICALLAGAIQAIVVGAGLRALNRLGSGSAAKARLRIVIGHRLAALLLAVATLAMVAWRYA
jgi:hypothetical protein